MSPNIANASYTGPRSRGQSARSLASYLERHGEKDREIEYGQEPQHRVQIYGDREEFVGEATRRAEDERRSSYTHVVVSPERGEEFSDRDFEKLVETWTRDRDGQQCSHFAAIHRDTDHPHVHIAAARDKFTGKELEDLKRETEERIAERERFCDLRREAERPLQAERDQDREPPLEREAHERELRVERPAERGADSSEDGRGGHEHVRPEQEVERER